MFGIGGVIKIVAILIIVLVLAGGFWHISNLKANLAISEANNAKLEDGIQKQKELVELMQQDIEQIQHINRELQDVNTKNQEQLKQLTDKFSVNAKGEKRDFGAIAASKPKSIERLVNRGTQNVVRCLEILTGAPHTEKELNAKLTSETNRECPDIANPNFIPTVPTN